MGTRTENLHVKFTSDGTGQVKAELSGGADAVRRVGSEAQTSSGKLTNMTTVLRGLALGGGFVLGFREIAQAITAVGKAAIESEQADNRFNGVMRATGRDALNAASGIKSLIDELQKSTGFDGEEIKNATAELLTFDRIQGETLERAIRLGTDLAALYDGNLGAAFQQVGRALQDPLEGLGALERRIGALAPAQQKMLDDFKRTGDAAGAQALILETLDGKLGGVAQTINTGLTGGVSALANSWDDMLAALGRTDAVAGSADVIMRPLSNLMDTATQVLEQRISRLELLQGKLKPLDAGPGIDVAGVNQAGAAQFGAPPKLATGLPVVDKEMQKATESARQLTAALRLQANTFSESQVALVGYRIAVGDLNGASDQEKANALLAAQALDEKNAITEEATRLDRLYQQGIEDRLRTEQEANDAQQKINAEQNQRARDLADRGNAQRAATRSYEENLESINAAFSRSELTAVEYYDALGAASREFVDRSQTDAAAWADAWTSAGNRFTAGIGDAVADAIVEQKSFAEAMEALLKNVFKQIISSLVELAIKRAILSQLGLASAQTEAAVMQALGLETAAAWAAAAAEVSLASFGANAIPAQAGLASTHALSQALAVAGQAHDGMEDVPRTGTYVLEEGEAVIQKDQNRDLREFLRGARGGGGTRVTFNIRAVDTRGFAALLRTQRGAITTMIQQAYNARARGRQGPAG